MAGKRRCTAIGLAALGVAGALAAIAWAAPFQSLSASVAPNDPGTKKKPTNVELAVSMTTSTSPPSDPLPTTTKFQLFLPKELLSKGNKFVGCPQEWVNDDDPSTHCPNHTKVGRGSGSVVVGATPIEVTITVYNGFRGNSWLLRMQAGSPFAFDEYIKGKLSFLGRRGFGHKLVFAVPAELQTVKLQELNLDVGARGGGGIPFLGLGPCPDGALSFKTVHTYAGTSSAAKATATDNCG